jgi:hypothetical protein
VFDPGAPPGGDAAERIYAGLGHRGVDLGKVPGLELGVEEARLERVGARAGGSARGEVERLPGRPVVVADVAAEEGGSSELT